MILRSYQHEPACDVLSCFENVARTVLLVMPCRSGKTPTLCYVVSHEPGRVWVIAHRQELIAQASETLDKFNIAHGVVKSGYPFDPKQRVQVASIQTLARRYHLLPKPDLIVADEAHHSVSNSYQKVIGDNRKARVLGVTATPVRLNGQGLGEVFEHMIIGPSARWLTDEGFLTAAEYYAPPQVADTSHLSKRGGDYAKDEMAEVMDRHTVTGDAVEHYQRICDGVPIIVFCTTILHAEHVAKQYADAGYRAVSVDGSMSDADRKDRIYGLDTGKYQVVTSCELVGEGLDIPGVTAVQLLRPTASLGLHNQQICRPLNPVYADGFDLTTKEGRLAAIAAGPKPRAFILDHVNNSKHGLPTKEHQWTLAGTTKKKRDSVPALRTCSSCFLAHEPSPTCPNCGTIYPVATKALHRIETVDGKLVKIEETKEERSTALQNARSMVELIAFAKARGYQRPSFWAMKVFKGRSYTHHMPRI